MIPYLDFTGNICYRDYRQVLVYCSHSKKNKKGENSMSIVNLRRQHTEIGQVIEETENILRNKSLGITSQSKQLALNIANLAGRLQNHLLLEDKFLYPSLAEHKDPQVQALSKRFSEEMGNLNEVFAAYKTKYMIANNIRNNPEDFYKDSLAVFKAIKSRIMAEEKELYPLV
jgi:hemerythrin-like domain-containing protein